MLDFRTRIRHFTFANFALTIAGGGTASMLRQIPYRFKGLTAIGDIIFIFNFTITILFTILMITRFVMHPDKIKKSLRVPAEAFFMPAYLLTWATILMDTEVYAKGHTGVWRPKTMRVLYWVYCAVCVCQGTAQYVYMYLQHKLTLSDVNPGMLLVAFPMMLTGTLASTFSSAQNHNSAMQMIISGTTLQLLGFNISMMIYTILIYKFLTKGTPDEDTRPGMFIMVGPLAFTGLCLVGLGQAAESRFPEGYISKNVNEGSVFLMIGIFQGLLCWASSLWFWLVSAVACLHGAFFKGMKFRLAWCATVFPTAGMTILTFKLGEVLDENRPLKWLGTSFGACVGGMYVICLLTYIKAVVTEQIMAPGKDEDAISFIEQQRAEEKHEKLA